MFSLVLDYVPFDNELLFEGSFFVIGGFSFEAFSGVSVSSLFSFVFTLLTGFLVLSSSNWSHIGVFSPVSYWSS